MNISKSRKYYLDKVAIDKRNGRKAAHIIQIYNNNVVDNYIREYNEGIGEKPKESVIWADLAILNKPYVNQNYQRILDSPWTSNENFEQMIIRNQANKNLNQIVEVEVERVSKNLDYIENFLKNNELPQQKYEKILNEQKNKSIASRLDLVKTVALEANKLAGVEGLNIPPNVFTYRNIDATARSMFRNSQMVSEFDRIKAINREFENNGKDPKYTKKRWIWTGEGKTTRHESNNMQVRDLDIPFTIVNDATLEIDELMYPMDFNGSFGNAYCCYCEVEYF